MGSTPIGEMNLPIINTNTDRVYLVSDSGVLHCLREPGNRWPIARKPAVIETPEVETETTEAPSDPFSPPVTSAQEEQPAETGDSFGGFGAEDDAAEDTETDAVDDSDPFAFGDDDAATNDDDGGGGDGNDDAEADDSDPFG